MELKNAKVGLIVENEEARNSMESLFRSLGFQYIDTGSTLEDVLNFLSFDAPDLLVVGVDQSEEIHNLVRDVRHNKIGKNPFLPIISVTTEPTKKIVTGVASSGSDDLLTYPVSTPQLDKRIMNLIDKRKPFVVTSDYIGPDRRASLSQRDGEMDIPRINVPNVLRSKVTGEMSEEEMEAEISKALQDVNMLRLDRCSDQISWLIHRILAGYAWGEGKMLEPEIKEFLGKLNVVASDTGERLDGTDHEHISYLCTSLLTVSNRMEQAGERASEKDKELLSELAMAFKGAFSGDANSEAARGIRDAIN